MTNEQIQLDEILYTKRTEGILNAYMWLQWGGGGSKVIRNMCTY